MSPKTTERKPLALFRVLLLGTLFSVLGILWSLQVSLVGESVHLAGSVPAIPAVATLLLLSTAFPFLRRYGVTRAEILLITVFVAVATATTDSNCLLAYFFAFLVVSRHAPARETLSASLTKGLPRWFVPDNLQAMRDFCEGNASVPWHVWLMPLLGWLLFFLALWITLFAILRLFRDRWISHERLRFPIVDLMVSLAPPEGGTGSLLRNRLLWAGAGCSILFNALNMWNAFDPKIPATGVYIPIGGLFTSPPWSSLAPLSVSLRPEIFGIGYLMHSDVLLTAWLSYVILRLSNVVATASGVEVRTGPFDYQEIASGAYLGVLFVLLWAGRSSIGVVLREARDSLRSVSRSHPEYDAFQTRRRYTVIAVLGFLYQLAWAVSAGMVWWLAVLFLGLIVCFAVVYSRIRAETGAPIWYLFPFWQQQKLLVNLFGTGLLGAGGSSSLAVLAVMGFLGRGTFPELSAWHIETMELGERMKVRTRSIAIILVTALVVGLSVGSVLFLQIAYHKGYYSIDGGVNGNGGWRVMMALQQYQDLASWKSRPTPPNLPLIAHTLFGIWLTITMSGLRSKFLGFPLHPLGLAMGASYGYHLWFPFLLVWIVKGTILRVGGIQLYRHCIPFFLGIVLGHYFMAGIVWGGLSLFLPDLTRKFPVQFA